MTLEEIARLCDSTVSTFGDLATGRSAEPRGETAVKLHELHKERCPPKRGGRASAGAVSKAG